MNTLHSLHKTIGGTLSGNVGLEGGSQLVSRVVTDSRHVQSGDVFWGLVGTQHDGAEFAAEAFRRGGAGMVVDRPVDVPAGRWAIRVDDPLVALHQWAGRARDRFSAR